MQDSFVLLFINVVPCKGSWAAGYTRMI